MKLLPLSVLACLALLAGLSCPASAFAVTLRIVTYNINADTDGYTAARPGLDTVLEAIGQQSVNGVAQPPDIVALEETTSNTATVAPLVATLNNYYGRTVYAYSTNFQATEAGGNPSTGNGPNSMIYNKETLVLLGSVGVGTPHGATNGESRQIARYEFQPVGGTAPNDFYVYVSHMKSSFSGTDADNMTRRANEAKILRDDADALPANSGIIYTGDFNLSGSTEAAYQTITATGSAQGIDPLNNNPQDNTQTWDSAAFAAIDTESATAIEYRDDIQFMSPAVFNGTVTGGLTYIAGSYRAFGNNGTTAFRHSVNSTTNTALNNLAGPITASAALSALTTASDHLPIVADYSIDLLEAPVITSATAATTQVGIQFTYQITATNHPTSFNVINPPPGLSLNPATGVLSGKVTQSGNYSTTLLAYNSSGQGTAELKLTVTPQAKPVITSAADAPARQGVKFYYHVTATNSPVSYAASGLPAGLAFKTSTGEITGTPTVYGAFAVSISATNSGGTGLAKLNLAVKQAVPAITGSLTPPIRQGVAFAYQITATNSPTKYGASGLPAGLTINQTTGKIAGTPGGFGTFTPTIAAFNSGGSVTAKLSLSIKQATPAITSSLSASGRVGAAFTYQITATRTPTKYGASGLPAGLAINQTTGKITGKPTKAGTYGVTLAAFNAAGSGVAKLNVVISAASPVGAGGE